MRPETVASAVAPCQASAASDNETPKADIPCRLDGVRGLPPRPGLQRPGAQTR